MPWWKCLALLPLLYLGLNLGLFILLVALALWPLTLMAVCMAVLLWKGDKR